MATSWPTGTSFSVSESTWRHITSWRLAEPAISISDVADEPFTQAELDHWLEEGIRSASEGPRLDDGVDAGTDSAGEVVSTLFGLEDLSFDGSARTRRRRHS